MRKVPVDEAPAGPAMDAAAAEVLGLQVLGFAGVWRDECGTPYLSYNRVIEGESRPVYLAPSCICEFREQTDVDYFGHIAGCLEIVPCYSIDIAAAWELWRHLARSGTWSFDFSNDGGGWCIAIFYHDDQLARCEGDGGDDEAVIICRAFLKANGVEFIEVPE